MKNLIILSFILIGLSSCEKAELPTPKLSEAVHSADDTLIWNLYFKTTFRDTLFELVNAKPYKISRIVNYEPPYYQETEIGKVVYFKSNDDNLLVVFSYYYSGGIKRVTGRFNTHSFISNYDCSEFNSTVNVCNGTQGLPIIYDLFYKGNSNY